MDEGMTGLSGRMAGLKYDIELMRKDRLKMKGLEPPAVLLHSDLSHTVFGVEGLGARSPREQNKRCTHTLRKAKWPARCAYCDPQQSYCSGNVGSVCVILSSWKFRRQSTLAVVQFLASCAAATLPFYSLSRTYGKAQGALSAVHGR
eukprot:6199091-Pleurochrysis_carterae.AAC.1